MYLLLTLSLKLNHLLCRLFLIKNKIRTKYYYTLYVNIKLVILELLDIIICQKVVKQKKIRKLCFKLLVWSNKKTMKSPNLSIYMHR